MTLGGKIADFRNKIPLSQQELADQMELPLKTITIWESGIRDPNGEEREKLAKILSVDLGELVADEDGGPIFRDHPEDMPVVNLDLCRKYGIMFYIGGFFLFCSAVILSVTMQLPAFLAFCASAYFFNKSAPNMTLSVKIILAIGGGLLAVMLRYGIFLVYISVLL